MWVSQTLALAVKTLSLAVAIFCVLVLINHVFTMIQNTSAPSVEEKKQEVCNGDVTFREDKIVRCEPSCLIPLPYPLFQKNLLDYKWDRGTNIGTCRLWIRIKPNGQANGDWTLLMDNIQPN